jgi:ubiquinone/menaquinone biosynthesis C-methylase UbiE
VFSKFQSGGSDIHLDVAAGLGYGTSLIGEWLDVEAVGVEIDGESVNYADRHYGGNGAFIRGDATRLPLATNSATTVTCFETLEHIPDEQLLLEQLDRVLASNGVLIISVPNDEQVGSSAEEEKQFPHVNTYTPRRLTQLLESVFGSGAVTLFDQYKQLKIPDAQECDTPPHPTGIYPCSNQTSSDQLIAIVDKSTDTNRSYWWQCTHRPDSTGTVGK